VRRCQGIDRGARGGDGVELPRWRGRRLLASTRVIHDSDGFLGGAAGQSHRRQARQRAGRGRLRRLEARWVGRSDEEESAARG
jgi:hypothetical protein